jgi:hypothetical protein
VVSALGTGPLERASDIAVAFKAAAVDVVIVETDFSDLPLTETEIGV